MEPPRAFPYGRTFFWVRTFIIASLVTTMIAVLGIVVQTPAAWLALIGGALATYFLIIGLTPLFTAHELLRSRIILRQGWYFRCIVPFADVASIRPWEADVRSGLHLSLARDTLYVVGSPRALVALKLNAPRRFPHVLYLSASKIVFDVTDRQTFLAAFEQRRQAEALPAKKVPVLPARR